MATEPAATTAWVSWMRVLAIVAVVVIHTTGSTATADGAAGTAVGRVAIIGDIGGIAAVPLFVMLSGVLLLDPDRYRGARDFLRRRAARLLPAIAFWHLWYLAVRLLRGERPDLLEILGRVVRGQLYTQLYFFWIVLGLAVLTPVLMLVVRRWGTRGAVLAGAVGMTATALGAALGLPTTFVHTAVTWWLPYVGAYLLGWGLRGVRLRGAALAATAVLTIGLGALLIRQWGWGAPEWLDRWAPVSYYGAGVGLYTVGLFLVGRALVTPDGVLRALTTPSAARIGRTLGDVTLGVFGVHLTVIAVLTATGWLGGGGPAADVVTLLARIAVVLVVSFAFALLARRVPLLRRVV